MARSYWQGNPADARFARTLRLRLTDTLFGIRREQLRHVIADFAQHFFARLFGRRRDSPHDRRADDQPIGHRREQLYVLGLC